MNSTFRTLATILLAVSVIFLVSCAKRNPTQIPEPEGSEFKLISQTQTPGFASGVSLVGDRLYTAEDERGVFVWDISDLSLPTIIDTIKTSTEARHIEYAYESNVLVIHETNYITAIKHTTDTSRVVFQPNETGVSNIDIFERGLDNIIIGIVDPDESRGSFRVQIIHPDPDYPDDWWLDDISANLLDINGVPILGYNGLEFDIPNSCAYLAHGQYGIDIAEVSLNGDLIALSLLGTVDTYGYAEDIALCDDGVHAVIADGPGGLQIFDISDKTNPVWVSGLIPSGVGDAIVVEVVGDTVYFLDRYDGVFAVDITNPEEPVLIAKYNAPAPTGIAIGEDNIIFVSDQDLGLIVLELIEY
jgi:hypothetical protein